MSNHDRGQVEVFEENNAEGTCECGWKTKSGLTEDQAKEALLQHHSNPES